MTFLSNSLLQAEGSFGTFLNEINLNILYIYYIWHNLKLFCIYRCRRLKTTLQSQLFLYKKINCLFEENVKVEEECRSNENNKVCISILFYSNHFAVFRANYIFMICNVLPIPTSLFRDSASRLSNNNPVCLIILPILTKLLFLLCVFKSLLFPIRISISP